MQQFDFYTEFSGTQIQMLKKHLNERFEYRKSKNVFGVVFDILHQCDLQCRGCGTNASFTSAKSVHDISPTLQDIEKVFKKIKIYSDEIQMPAFVNIGGGEPFLRNDILDILKLATEYFGCNGVGVDTNATLDNSYELISKAMDYVSYVGISVNGLEEYHNWWSGNNRINAYRRTLNVVEKLCMDEGNKNKLEVTSVATKKNLNDLPQLMDELVNLNVTNYSVHRAIPVGRMANLSSIIPDASDYIRLLVSILERSHQNGMIVHLHHSIESIHATLLLGLNTYDSDKIGDPDAGSSIGIEPEGTLVFDPWCTTGLWKNLSGGCIFDFDTQFRDLVGGNGGTVFDLSKIYTAPHLRCKGCEKTCSGGSRIASAAEVLNKLNIEEITDSHILDAMTAIDPACPLFYTNK